MSTGDPAEPPASDKPVPADDRPLDDRPLDDRPLDDGPVEDAPRDDAPHDAEPGGHRHRWHGHGGDVPILVDETDDRWAWRRRIRADPRKARIYRIGVGVLGVLLILLGGATGPLPGPGGIPLVLLGLAVLASEFEWAQRLMHWFRAQLHRFQRLSRRQQVLIWAILIVAVATALYGYLLILGVPLWVPAPIADPLHRLPGV